MNFLGPDFLHTDFFAHEIFLLPETALKNSGPKKQSS